MNKNNKRGEAQESAKEYREQQGRLKKGGSIHYGKMCLAYCGDACDCELSFYNGRIRTPYWRIDET